MTYQDLTNTVELIRTKYRFYGISITPLDDCISDPYDYMILGRLGLAVIESIERPADAYYIQRVVFPAFVKRVVPLRCKKNIDCSFESMLTLLHSLLPQLYFDVTTWPASIRS